MDQNKIKKIIIGCQLEMSIQGQSITNNANMLQTTIGIVSTPPVDLTEDTNRDTKKTHKEKPTLLKAG